MPRARQARCGGFAVAVALFALVIIGVIVSGGAFVALRQFQVGLAGLQASSGLYVAEAGLHAALAHWDPAVALELQPGAMVPLVSGSLPTGDEYATWLTRLDSGRDSLTAYYLLSSVGRPHGPGGGRRHLALFLSSRLPDLLCCDAALRTGGDVSVSEGARVSGLDVTPGAWRGGSDVCGGRETMSGPGIIVVGDSASVSVALEARVEGEPAIAQWQSGDADFMQRVDVRYDELVEHADFHYHGGLSVGGIGPVLGPDGECDQTSPRNWGAPSDPAHRCFNYFPIVHAAGDLQLAGPGSGQGILLVDGDLEVQGGFEFYGVVIVKGRLRVEGEGVGIHGGVRLLGAWPEGAEIGRSAAVGFSSCAVWRAAAFSQLHIPHPLAERAWYEILR